MHRARVATDHLRRAERLRKIDDPSSKTYAALELRLGIEARLKEYLGHAVNVSKSKLKHWEIRKLGKILEGKYGGSQGLQILFVTLNGQRARFMYVPVSDRLQKIGERLGDYLHWQGVRGEAEEHYWAELSALLHEGCGLLQLACAGEVLRPSFTEGLHFTLDENDPRVPLVQALCNGAAAEFEVFQIDPVGPITYYPADEAA